MSITERRYREGLGAKLTKNGKPRCHGLSKGKIRRWRQEHDDDFETPTEDLWPECQCENAAVQGMFACKYHGGITTKNKDNIKTFSDSLPVDLAHYFKAARENPTYISRHDDILLFQARNMELLQELDDIPDNDEVWGMVADAYHHLIVGDDKDVQTAYNLLKQALDNRADTNKKWDEIRTNTRLVNDLTNTQVRTAKELRMMATHEQVDSLMTGIMNAIIRESGKYLDESNRTDFLAAIATAVGRLTNTGYPQTTGWIEAGSDEVS